MTKRVLVKTAKRIFALGMMLLVISSVPLIAQPGDTDIGDPDAGIPVDGGISLLLAAGAAFGARKIYLARKNEKQDDVGYNPNESGIK